MVYGIAKMLNFAHGDIIMVGGYAVFTAMSTAWCPVWLSVIIGIVVCTVLGVVIEKVAYKPLRNAPPLAVLITAIGAHTIRMVPPLIVNEEQCDKAVEIITEAVEAVAK